MIRLLPEKSWSDKLGVTFGRIFPFIAFPAALTANWLSNNMLPETPVVIFWLFKSIALMFLLVTFFFLFFLETSWHFDATRREIRLISLFFGHWPTRKRKPITIDAFDYLYIGFRDSLLWIALHRKDGEDIYLFAVRSKQHAFLEADRISQLLALQNKGAGGLYLP